ncbi:MAG TPA: hypothetical protein VGK29_06855 [Paludibaculum sp.]|jgi:hypothetical protein
MADDFAVVFGALKPLLAGCAERLSVKTDVPGEYTLETKSPSPFPQHKGQPLFFASARTGKAYVSLHLLPLYMCPKLTDTISPALKKRMQGKACFNFKAAPEASLVAELKQLMALCLETWSGKGWL